MKVNGKEVEAKPAICLSEFLENNGYQLTKIAVERNGEIVPKRSYGEVILSENDSLEIVSFVGGG